ncbi:MAG TPA: acetamidase/formamidase family protein [Puia sp.]|nr:acetamidase/formamidase family protein [Puia sp.]
MKFLLFALIALCLQCCKAQQRSSEPPPKLRHFTPTRFSNKFTLNVTPVLHLHDGDTVSTETIDATGRDKNGSFRNGGGNPLTGPFFIENAEPGDVLKITLNKVGLNRPYAYTTESFIARSVPDSISKLFKKGHLVRWKLDFESMTGHPDSSASPYADLTDFKIPLRPFLGCIGVAPANGKNEILSFFEGDFGGNMDFPAVAESAIIYLPVFHPGAYFYVGDGHAVQGDGEIAGNALETSLDVTFTVNVIKGGHSGIKTPRLENSTYIMTVGCDKSLDNAIKRATADLLNWLQRDYRLTLQEATQVMSPGIEYTIPEIADPQVIVVARIRKELLAGLKKVN